MKKSFGSSSSVEANLESRKRGLANAAQRRMGAGGIGRGGTVGSSGLASAESITADRSKRFARGLNAQKAGLVPGSPEFTNFQKKVPGSGNGKS